MGTLYKCVDKKWVLLGTFAEDFNHTDRQRILQFDTAYHYYKSLYRLEYEGSNNVTSIRYIDKGKYISSDKIDF